MLHAGVWAEQRADDGRRYYWNKYTNTSKWELTEEEKQRLVPNLDPYNNDMVMSLQVCFIRDRVVLVCVCEAAYVWLLVMTLLPTVMLW